MVELAKRFQFINDKHEVVDFCYLKDIVAEREAWQKDVDAWYDAYNEATGRADKLQAALDKAETEVIRLKKMLGIGIGGKQ
jgi:hypothetical protein